jgi:hypothetical protein
MHVKKIKYSIKNAHIHYAPTQLVTKKALFISFHFYLKRKKLNNQYFFYQKLRVEPFAIATIVYNNSVLGLAACRLTIGGKFKIQRDEINHFTSKQTEH